jgi:hypothetical protein
MKHQGEKVLEGVFATGPEAERGQKELAKLGGDYIRRKIEHPKVIPPRYGESILAPLLRDWLRRKRLENGKT